MFFHKIEKTMEEVHQEMLRDPSIQLVDVRTQEEYAEGHIASAILLPLAEIELLADQILPNKKAMYYVYCRSGQRANKAVHKLEQMGYANVQNIGGIVSWPYELKKGSVQ